MKNPMKTDTSKVYRVQIWIYFEWKSSKHDIFDCKVKKVVQKLYFSVYHEHFLEISISSHVLGFKIENIMFGWFPHKINSDLNSIDFRNISFHWVFHQIKTWRIFLYFFHYNSIYIDCIFYFFKKLKNWTNCPKLDFNFFFYRS